MDNKEIGTRIEKFRRARGLNQNELAFKIGMSGANLGKIERGVNNLMAHYVPDLVKTLKIDANELFDVKSAVAEEQEKMGFATKAEVNHLAQKVEVLAKAIERLIAEWPGKNDSYKISKTRKKKK